MFRIENLQIYDIKRLVHITFIRLGYEIELFIKNQGMIEDRQLMLDDSYNIDLKTSAKTNFYCMFMMNEMETIRFHSQNGFPYISRIVYRSDPCLYAKRTGGHHLSAHIKHNTVGLTRTEI